MRLCSSGNKNVVRESGEGDRRGRRKIGIDIGIGAWRVTFRSNWGKDMGGRGGRSRGRGCCGICEVVERCCRFVVSFGGMSSGSTGGRTCVGQLLSYRREEVTSVGGGGSRVTAFSRGRGRRDGLLG